MRRERKFQAGAGRSLNLILWFAFSAFALVLILLFVAVQSLFVGQRYRDETLDAMKEAGARASEFLEEGDGSAVWRQLPALEEDFDVNIRFLLADGSAFDRDGKSGERYPEIAEIIADRFDAGETEAIVHSDTSLIYLKPVMLEGTRCYLYVSGSLSRIDTLESSLRWLSLASALIAIVLAFVASGFVAMLITRPVTEVTARAKELARGHFNVNARKNYFCSEISELSDALDYASSEISRADAIQKELIANVSHDFKTPLTMIKAYASMIREISGDDKEKRDYHAQVIIDEADRLAALVGDVLDLSKLRAGVGEQAPTAFDLSETVYKIMRRFDYLSDTQGYRFDLELEDELYVYANRERIEQVVYNLVGNAVNYTGEDKRVFVKAFRKGEYCRLEVSDTGRGIPAGELENIWDRYYRIGETHKRPVQGTGLGLSIVKGILQNQNCPFGAESEVGKGSMFWAEIPIPPEDRNGTKEEGA